MSKSGSRLGRLGVLAPAALSACIDASVLAAPAAGALLCTVLNELNKAFMLKKWFHGVMSAQEAEQLLLQKGKQGSYLVRESCKHPGEYVLSVRVRGRVSHVMIRREQNKYNVGSGEVFDDLSGLIEHCRAYPLTKASGEVLRLRQPVSGGRSRPRAHDKGISIKLKNQTMDQAQKNVEDLKLLEIEDEDLDYGKSTNVDINFESEYQLMVKEPDALHKFKKLEGHKEENRKKNRYKNVVPYDETRVPLPLDTYSMDENCTDYINASYIRPQWMFDELFSVLNGKKEHAVTVHSADCRREDISFQSNEIPSNSSSLLSFYTLNILDGNTVQYRSELELEDDDYYPIPRQIHHIQYDKAVAKDKFYIATQGCLASTVHAFWAMIADNDVRVIAMLTRCEENGLTKCDKYWPLLNESWTLGNLELTLVAEYCLPYYTLREILLTSTSGNIKKRTIVHQYQFLLPTEIWWWNIHTMPSIANPLETDYINFVDWLDHSVPVEYEGNETKAILRFIRDINECMIQVVDGQTAPKQNILCVHCSAGIGRTGTFIAIDMIIDMIKTQQAGDLRMNPLSEIQAVVKLLRKQRPGMVQNVKQYKFIYRAVTAYINNIVKNDGKEEPPDFSVIGKGQI